MLAGAGLEVDVESDEGLVCAWDEVEEVEGVCAVDVELVLGAVVVDWLVEVPVPVEFCAGVDVDVDGVVVVVEPGWLWVVVEVAGAVDGDCANAAVANARLMAEVVKRRIFIVLAPVVRLLLPPLTGSGGPGSANREKQAMRLADEPQSEAPQAAPSLTVLRAIAAAEELLPFFAVHSATPQGKTKMVYTCLFGAISHFPAAFFSHCCCWQIGTCRNRRQSLRGLRSTRP